MTEPGRAPQDDPIAATQQFRRFATEDLSAEVAQGRSERTKKLLILIAVLVVLVVIVVVIALVV